MADISKCPGTNCPMRDSCYRYVAEPNGFWQAYFSKSPITTQDDKPFCQYYWPNKNEKSN